MSDLSISDDELAMLLAMNGDVGAEFNSPSVSSAQPAKDTPPAEPAAPAERILSQAEIDALLASLSGG